MLLSILGWVVVGLVVGFVASKVVNLRGDDPRLGMGAAAGAAVVAGLLHRLIAARGDAGWDAWGLLFAAVGAAVGAVVWHLVRSRFISHVPYVQRRSY